MNAATAKAALRLVPTDPVSAPGSPPAQTPTPTAPAGQPAQSDAGAVQPGKTGGFWAKYCGKMGAALTVGLSGAIIRKGGREPNDADDQDVELMAQALEEGLLLQYGEKNIPWYLGAMMAGAGIYAGMRINAPKIKTDEEKKVEEIDKNMPPPAQLSDDTLTPEVTEEPEPGEHNESSLFPAAMQKKFD